MDSLTTYFERGVFIKGSFESFHMLFKEADRILTESGLVNLGFLDKLVEREIEYPTGLKTSSIPIAIPHCDYEFIKQTCICVASLDEPVRFHQMDSPQSVLEVRLVFFLLLKDKIDHLNLLQQFFSLVQDRDLALLLLAESKDGFIKEIFTEREKND